MPSKESIEEFSSLKSSSVSMVRGEGSSGSLLWCSCLERIRCGLLAWLGLGSAARLFLPPYSMLGDLEVRVTGLHLVTLFSELVTKLCSLKLVLLEAARHTDTGGCFRGRGLLTEQVFSFAATALFSRRLAGWDLHKHCQACSIIITPPGPGPDV